MIAFTTQDLYDLVWSKPMTAIAAEFGVEPMHFAKMCDVHNIPRPLPGYWQKLQFGKQIEQPELVIRISAIADPVQVKKIRPREAPPAT